MKNNVQFSKPIILVCTVPNYKYWTLIGRVYDLKNICARLILFGIRHTFVVLMLNVGIENVEPESYCHFWKPHNIFHIAMPLLLQNQMVGECDFSTPCFIKYTTISSAIIALSGWQTWNEDIDRMSFLGHQQFHSVHFPLDRE